MSDPTPSHDRDHLDPDLTVFLPQELAGEPEKEVAPLVAAGAGSPAPRDPLPRESGTVVMGSVDASVGSGLPDRLDVKNHLDLESEIAHGGMGVVVKGRDRRLGRQIAIKILQERYRGNDELVRRFVDEARIAAQLQHPGVVPIYEAGHLPDDRPYFVMKLVGGKTLEQLLAERGVPSHDLPRFLKIFELVCQTMAYCHDRGVIHRDLKPENVMVGSFGEVQVMDWGIAKQLRPEQFSAQRPQGAARSARLQPENVTGTLAYMPPEQAKGDLDELDVRADVFCLGGILCKILTGHPPYAARDNVKLYRLATTAKLNTAFARLDACGADPELILLARHCLAKDRNDRPANAADVQQTLTAYLEAILRQPERDLIRFFELSLDLFCIAGLDGFFRRVNSNFSRVLGYAADELVSRPFIEFVHPEDRERTAARMAQLSQGLPVVRFRNRYRTAAGSYRWFEWTSKAVTEDGLVFAVARDVTEQVNADRLTNLAVEAASAGLVMIARDGRITLVNRQTEQMFGYAREELLGQPIEMLVPTEIRDIHPQLRESFFAAPTVRPIGAGRELFGHRKDGSRFPVEIGLSPLETEEGLFALASVIDITERKLANAALAERARLAELASEIGSALTHSSDLRRMLGRCTEILVRHLDAAFVRIWTIEPGGAVLELQASAGLYTHLDGPHSRVPLGQLKIGLIAQERRPHLSNQVVSDPRVSDQGWAKREGMVAFAGHPLIVDDRVVGVLGLFARHPLSDATLASLASVADGIALGIAGKQSASA